jgi:predicted O-methyltransferase YrrM
MVGYLPAFDKTTNDPAANRRWILVRMDKSLFGAVERYIGELYGPEDPALAAAVHAAEQAGLPSIQISPGHGKLLQILARAVHANRILEIGTLGGYSTIWLARALPPAGRLVTLEIDERRAAVARSNIARAGLSEVAEVRVAPATDSLRRMADRAEAPFDLVFIDADEPNYVDYLDATVKLSRPGSLIVVDNVVREGAVLDPDSADPRVIGSRRFNEKLAADTRLAATLITTIGQSSYDGMAIALVLSID